MPAATAAAPRGPSIPTTIPTIDASPTRESQALYQAAQAAASPTADRMPAMAGERPGAQPRHQPTPPPAPTSEPRQPTAPVEPPEPPTPEPRSEDYSANFDDLDELAKGPKVEPTGEPAKPKEGETTEPKGPFSDQQIDEQVDAHKHLRPLRDAHKVALRSLREKEQANGELAKKLAEMEGKLKAGGDPEASKALSEQLAAANKRAEELEARVKALDYRESREFHDKYRKPVADAMAGALADVKEMNVTQADGSVRPATDGDFVRLLNLKPQDAAEAAVAMFGQHAAIDVLNHRRAVLQLKRAESEAVQSAGKLGEEHRQKLAAESTQTAQRVQQTLQKRMEETAGKYPQLFKTRESDQEWNKHFANGERLIKTLDDPELPEESRLALAGDMRLRIVGYGPLLYERNLFAQKLADAEAKLKSFEGSRPAPGNSAPNGQPQTPADPMDRALQGIDALARPYHEAHH